MNDTIRHLIWCISVVGAFVFYVIIANVLAMYIAALVS